MGGIGIPLGESQFQNRRAKIWVKVLDQTSQDFFIEIEVPTMKGKEEPRAVNLEIKIRKANLVICTITISTVDVGLLGEIAWIVERQSFHATKGFFVIAEVSGIN